jgi:hypothetical protein
MIRNFKEKTSHSPSFIQGYIDQLFDIVESEHKSFKKAKLLDTKTMNRVRIQARENSESVLLFREQLNKWKQEAQSQSQQQLIVTLEQKLSKITRLNAAI